MRVRILDPELAFAEALAVLLSARPDVIVAEPASTVGAVRAALATGHYDVPLVETQASGYDRLELSGGSVPSMSRSWWCRRTTTG